MMLAYRSLRPTCSSLLKTSRSARLFSSEHAPKNVDGKEVDHFSQHAGDWLNPTGALKALHSMNQIRVPFIRDGLVAAGSVSHERINTATVLTDLRILDVGCGAGILSVPLARLGAKVTGLDAAKSLIDAAIDNRSCLDPQLAERLQFQTGAIEEHIVDEKAGSYDAVVASEVIEHVNDPASFLKSCVQGLKPGGSIFMTTLNKTRLSYFGAILMAENVLNLAPKNSHDWNKFIAPHEIERMLKDNNCSTVLVNGMAYDFLSNRWTWSKCKDINYAIHAVKNA